MSKHKCPVDGCEAQCQQHILMCYRHWKLVPKDLQVSVYRAWGVFRKAEPGAGDSFFVDSYLKIRQEAIDAVNRIEAPARELDDRIARRTADRVSRSRRFGQQMRGGAK